MGRIVPTAILCCLALDVLPCMAAATRAGAGQTLWILEMRNPARAVAVRKILAGG